MHSQHLIQRAHTWYITVLECVLYLVKGIFFFYYFLSLRTLKTIIRPFVCNLIHRTTRLYVFFKNLSLTGVAIMRVDLTSDFHLIESLTYIEKSLSGDLYYS